MSTPQPKKIEIFRPGTFVTSAGDEMTFSAADLQAVASAYDPGVHEAPLVVGHPKTDDPAHGWVTGLEFADGRLVATVDQVNPAFAAAVKRGDYKRVSAAFYPPASSANPKPGQYYLRHVGCLGAQPPAVSGLKPLNFAAGDADFIEFAQSDVPLGSTFRQLRDWIIGKFGLDEADKALPGWLVSWAEDADREPDPDDSATSPAFSEGNLMSKPDGAAVLAAREANVAAKEAALKAKELEFAERDRKARSAENATFIDGLIAAGKFLPTQKADTLQFMEALSGNDQLIAFSEAGATKQGTPLEIYRAQLAGRPKLVEFGEVAPGDGSVATVEFAAPPGAVIDPDRLKIHSAALAYQRAHPDTSYSQAVKAVNKE